MSFSVWPALSWDLRARKAPSAIWMAFSVMATSWGSLMLRGVMQRSETGLSLILTPDFLKQVEELGLAFEGHRFGLDGEGVDFQALDLLGDFVVDGFLAHDGGEPGGFALDLLVVAGVAEEEGFVGGEEEVGVITFEAGEPGDVGEAGEEEGVGELGGLGGGADFGEARGDEGFGSAFGLGRLFRRHEIPPNVNVEGEV